MCRLVNILQLSSKENSMGHSSAKGLIYFILTKIFVLCILLFVKNKYSFCFSCFLGLLYTLLLVFHMFLQPISFGIKNTFRCL